MDDIYQRELNLISQTELEKLEKKNILLFGLGGVGESTFVSLIRCGIKKLTIVDNDKFTISNLNRQILSNLTNINEYKVDVARQYAKNIDPNIEITINKSFYLGDYQIDFNQFDYVIDCIDTIKGKLEIIKNCYKNNIKIISSMGMGNRLDPTKLSIDDIYNTYNDPLAKIIRNKLKKEGIDKLTCVYSIEIPVKNIDSNTIGSIYFVPNYAGILISYKVIKDLIKED